MRDYLLLEGVETMADYQSMFEGQQIDEGIGKIINGAVDKAVTDAQAAATSAKADAAKTAADRLVVESASTAETGRVTAETKRVTAEKNRASGETTRKADEGNRATAETARASAETARTTAETARTTAETARKIAEEQRVARDAAESLCEPYDPMRDYVIGNKTVQSGSTYRCTAPCRGIAPPDRTKWLLVAAKGADGLGAGDMTVNVYDPTGQQRDIFAFAAALAAADIDCGTFDALTPVAAHNESPSAHAVMMVDGNATAEVGRGGELAAHENDPLAHQNIILDGNLN